MLTENQKKWIAALRSGEYIQGYHALQRPSGAFCCLGVACKVYEKNTDKNLATGPHSIIEGGSLYAQKEVMHWVGLRTGKGEPMNEGLSLIDLNDRGTSFNGIANILENSPEEYFVSPSDEGEN
ncbi:MAG: hypothetical protein Tp152SUR00d2C52646391_56 [Prokaryotic dsDNA virus sp.]|nr:MAG: hypothetical protein Tp152SUR00d2C52646391_56 [Prokaryotic dsDNA virus sp.]|tara:strand:- start:319 stop:690 length:372 start_codon:yes stop_codon:yes gene_type:complete